MGTTRAGSSLAVPYRLLGVLAPTAGRRLCAGAVGTQSA